MFKPLLKLNSVKLVLALLILSGVMLFGVYWLAAHPKETGGQLVAPEGSNPYFVGVCSNNPSQTCDPANPPPDCIECQTGYCSNNATLFCNPFICNNNANKLCGGFQDNKTCGLCSGSGEYCVTSNDCPTGQSCQGSCITNPSLLSDCGTCRNIVSDLDNCPAGPFSRGCFDPDFSTVQVSCSNSDQADQDLDLYGDICDRCGNGVCNVGENFCFCPSDCNYVPGQICCSAGPVNGNCCSNPQCVQIAPWQGEGVTALDYADGYLNIYSQDKIWVQDSSGAWRSDFSGFLSQKWSTAPAFQGRYPWQGPGVTGSAIYANTLYVFSKDLVWQQNSVGNWQAAFVYQLFTNNTNIVVGGQRPWEGPGVTAVVIEGDYLEMFSKDRLYVFDFSLNDWREDLSGFVSQLAVWQDAPVIGGQKPWQGSGITAVTTKDNRLQVISKDRLYVLDLTTNQWREDLSGFLLSLWPEANIITGQCSNNSCQPISGSPPPQPPPSGAICGNGTCELGETAGTCPDCQCLSDTDCQASQRCGRNNICTVCIDNDSDGYNGEAEDPIGGPGDPLACYGPGTWDCEDSNSAINPGAAEICDDGLDNNCDTLVDVEDPNCLPPSY